MNFDLTQDIETNSALGVSRVIRNAGPHGQQSIEIICQLKRLNGEKPIQINPEQPIDRGNWRTRPNYPTVIGGGVSPILTTIVRESLFAALRGVELYLFGRMSRQL